MDQRTVRLGPGASDKVILVTGGLGYVGSVLVPLLAKHYRVRVFDSMLFGNHLSYLEDVEFIKGDIRDSDLIASALGGVSAVIHLAGIVTDELVDMNPALARKINEDAFAGVVDQARNSGVERFIYASSSSVYGTQILLCSENDSPLPMTIYAKTKLKGEEILRNQKGKMEIAIVRSATCAGPSPRMRMDTIINIFCAQAFFKHKITVHGGSQYRTNIHIMDAAEFYSLLTSCSLETTRDPIWNITAGNHTALQLAQMVAQIIPAEIEVDSTKKDERHYRMAATKAMRELNWWPERTLEQAIKDNASWFADGHIPDPDSDLYYNTRRMAAFMRGENP